MTVILKHPLLLVAALMLPDLFMFLLTASRTALTSVFSSTRNSKAFTFLDRFSLMKGSELLSVLNLLFLTV